MRYKLYLDDMRYPPDNGPEWRLARNYHDALWYVWTYGIPYHISFDHDLADIHYENDDYGHDDEWMEKSAPYEFTGHDFAKWFCQHCYEKNVDLSEFSYNVHSANPVGAKRIDSYMAWFIDRWKKDGYV